MPTLLPYQDPSKSPDQRTADLLGRMTLEEKAGQMCQYVYPHEDAIPPPSALEGDDSTVHYNSSSLPGLLQAGWVGSILSESDPQRLNAIQRLALRSPLGIPLLFGIDAIHGNALSPGAAVFPAPIGLAAAWDPELVEQTAAATARELRAANLHWTFSPNVDVARDGRWGRTGETFGESPLLVGEMGKAMVRGYQGDLSDPQAHVLACAKHFIAGGEPSNGINFAAMDLSERALREVFLPPFAEAVKAGVATVMAAHNEINGVPCHGNHYLLTEILRDELGFSGFTVSDWTDVARLFNLHRVAASLQEADVMAVQAGIDMHMHGPGFLEPVVDAVRRGMLDEKLVEQAAGRILKSKFQLGMFEQPFADLERIPSATNTAEQRALALEAARRSLVLVHNHDRLLPLSPLAGRIFVSGPNANNQSILGDWSFPQPRGNIITILDGMGDRRGPGLRLDYFDPGDLLEIGVAEIEEARWRAAGADAAVLVVGENPLRYSPSRTEGENVDRSDLDLPGRQLDLVRAVVETGTPTVVVIVSGRPLSIPWIAEHAAAVLYAFHPGMMGGQAVAEVLFGAYNPGGKLPYSLSHSVGHQRLVYNHRPSDMFRKYALGPTGPLYPFGHGLSYTKFATHALHFPERVESGEPLPVQVTVENTGNRPGDEVVQVYLHDEYSSVTRPVKELAAFRRVTLQPGEVRTLDFTIQPEQMQVYDRRMQPRIEAGRFELLVEQLSGFFEVK